MEKLTLTFKDNQWTDQHGRRVVNPEVISWSGFSTISYMTYQWPGTYEDSHLYGTVGGYIRLIPPVASEPQATDADKFKRLRSDIARFQQTLIARNYNNIGQWHNERQQYNFELIEEVTKILIDNQP